MKIIAHALHPNALRGASYSQELRNTPKGEMKMNKLVNLAAAIVVVLPVAAAILLQAAQIVA
jgi:hypothetical protein